MSQIGTVKVETEDGTVELPVFELSDVGSNVYDYLRIRTSSGSGFIPLTDIEEAQYPYIRIQTRSQGTVAVHNEASLSIRPGSGVSRWTFDNEDTDGSTAIDTWSNNNGSIEGDGVTTGATG